MRALLDECLPRKLKRLLVGHQVTTVPEAGLAGLNNGRLLTQAAGRFDVLVTIDQSLPNQQNLQTAGLAVIILVAKSNRLDDLTPLAPAILAALPGLSPGQVIRISAPQAP